jgi:hypothetical protein
MISGASAPPTVCDDARSGDAIDDELHHRLCVSRPEGALHRAEARSVNNLTSAA